MEFSKKYREQIYAGVLGKLIGVYLGRPVESWSYEAIQERFGEVAYFVHRELQLPLIVADDDISGTFGFFKAMEDSGNSAALTAENIGDAWLNYIIENRSILWWGGLGNSSEHTAYLNLKKGIRAPMSGSEQINGSVISQQVGAQIFMDAYAMMCPGDPDRAVHYVRQCASVSHDGVALEAACFLGALEAAAFDEKDVNRLLDQSQRYLSSDLMKRLVADVRNECAKHSDWRKVRDFLGGHYSYDLYPGPSPMIPNHAIVLMALLMGGDDFAKSIRIGASAAWDTDCNAGNVGCLNGIRLGLPALSEGADFRGPVADRMYVITADGGEGISDAVLETRRIVRAAAALRGETVEIPAQRFAFEYPGSTQGFLPCPYYPIQSCPVHLSNANETGRGNGLNIHFDALAAGANARISTMTFLNVEEKYEDYETYVSPTLYSGQHVTACLSCETYPSVRARLYAWYADWNNQLALICSEYTDLCEGDTILEWDVPDCHGLPILRLGVEFASEKRFCGDVILRSVDWSNTPKHFAQSGIMMRDMWDLHPFWARMFVASAAHFSPNLRSTYCISHPEDGGLATIGTRDFTDYATTSGLKMSRHKRCGLVIRSRGHRQYYAALLSGGNRLEIVRVVNGEETLLAEAPFAYREYDEVRLTFSARGNHLAVCADNFTLETEDPDNTFPSGATGFLMDAGAMFINGITVEAI